MRVQLCQRRLSVQRIRQQRVERTRRPLETEPEVDPYFEPFDRLVDELVDKARPPFGEAIKRLEVLLAGRYDLFPAELDEEGARLCDEIAAVDRAIIALCQRYCEIGPHEFEFGCPPLHRMVQVATPRVGALILALNSYTARLNAFLDSVPRGSLN